MRTPENAAAVLLLTAMAATGTAANAQAAAAAGQSEDAAPDDRVIIVTAQKREQNLAEVPLSIAVLDGQELERRGANAIEDVQYAIPGLAITQLAPSQQRVSLRGISAFGGLPTVGVYLDEMPLNVEVSQTGQDVRLLDIRRIEVLRGPQGTLYGEGSLGGTIRYITNDVALARVEASARLGAGVIEGGGTEADLEGAVNLPVVTDRVGVRLAASYRRFGGWIDNPLRGIENVNDGEALTFRGKLRAMLTDRLDVVLMAQHQQLRLGAPNVSDADKQVFDRVSTAIRSDATLLNATLKYDFGGAELLSSTSYIDRADRDQFDTTATFAPALEAPPPFGFGFPPGTLQSIAFPRRSDVEIFSQEIRLSGGGGGGFTWTLGGYFRESDTRFVAETVVTPDILPPGLVLVANDGTFPANSRAWALFGEASYPVTSTLTALVGLRYFEDEREQDARSTVFGTTSVDQARETFDALSPRFNLAWQPNDRLNLYANIAKGFRSGGFNSTSTGAGLVEVPQSFAPEELWSYEVGLKAQTSDRSLVAEIAVYRNEWSDVQSLAFATGLPISFTVNGGKLAGWGAETSIAWTPLSAFTLSATAGWNNIEYVTNTAEHLAGDPADFVPEFTGSIAAEYRFRLAGVPAFARLDYQYSDPFQVFVRTFQTAPAVSDAQHLLGARLGIGGDRWNASAFVRNLLDRNSIVYPAFATLIYPARQEPRTFGVAMTFNY